MSKLEELVAKMYAKDPISKGEVEELKPFIYPIIPCEFRISYDNKFEHRIYSNIFLPIDVAGFLGENPVDLFLEHMYGYDYFLTSVHFDYLPEVEQRKRIKQARIKCGHIWGT